MLGCQYLVQVAAISLIKLLKLKVQTQLKKLNHILFIELIMLAKLVLNLIEMHASR